MLVETVVSRDVPTARAELDVRSAARLLLQSRCSVLPVVADEGGGPCVIGVLRYREAFAATYDGDEGHSSMPVAAAMTPAISTCRATDSLGVGLRQLRRSGDDAVPVLDEHGYLVGMLSFPDLIRALPGDGGAPVTSTQGGEVMANERAQDTQEPEKGRTSQQEARTARQEDRASVGSGGSRDQRGVARRESAQPATPNASPFTLMRRFMEDLDRLFVGGAPDTDWAPAVEVVERDGRLVVRADVPGLEKDKVNVEIDDGQLVISGERRQEHEERREGLYRSERVYGRFYRAIRLPDGADAEHATATFKNGVLEIDMPVTGRHQPRRVQVQDASSASAT